MPTSTFGITAGANDQYALSTANATYASLVYSSHNSTSGNVSPRRSFNGSVYTTYVGLLKWDTSSLPDTATITAATLRLNVQSVSDTNSRSLIGDYTSWSGVAGDWTNTAPASPVLSASITSLSSGGSKDIALTDFSGISKTGTTYLRLHVSGTAPAGNNQVTISSLEDTATEPQLIVTYTTNISPTAGFTYSGSGLTFSFTDTSTDPDGTIVSRLWDFGDGNTSTATNPSHTYLTGGSKTVTLTVTDNLGATDSDVQIITAVANTPPVAGFTYTGTGLTRAFTDASTDSDGTVVSRAWDFGDGTTSTSTNPSKTWAANGTYTVTLTVTDDDGATDSEIQSVTVAQAGAGKAYLSRVIPQISTTLDGGVNASQAQIPVVDLSYLPAEGDGLIDSEKITWTGKSLPSGVGNLTGVSRGQFSTLAATHSSGAAIAVIGRHDGGIATKRKIPTFPTAASITLQELRRHTDSERFAWVDFSNFRETAQLTVTASPTSSGNITTTLDEGGTATARTTAVSAAKEKRSLTINNAPTSSGDATVTLNGTPRAISLTSGEFEIVQLIITGSNPSNDSFKVDYINSSNVQASVSFSILAGYTATQIATVIAAGSYSGWTTSRVGATVTFTRTTAGDVANVSGQPHAVYISSNYFSFNAATVTQGSTALTAIGVADLIRNTSFTGWVTGGTAGTATVTIEALEPGPKIGTFSYSAGVTGATSTSGLTQTTAGAATSTDAVATAVRAVYSGNTYWTVGGAGSIVTWVATTSGAKLDATFTPGTTGTQATMETVNQGSSDVVAFIQDSAGVQQKRRVLANIATTTIFNIETSVSGAGTNKAVVTCYGSFAGDPLTHVWRVTDVDLTDHPLGEIAYGVTEESATGLIWDVHTDEIEVTDRGKTYYHDHDQLGALIGQTHYYGRLEAIQSRNDIFIQDLSIPVIPGEEVVIAAKLRYENAPIALPAKPLFVAAHHADGTVTDLRDVTGTTGISGTASWNEPTPYVFTVPETPSPCYEIRVASRDMSSGSIAIQQLVVSPGTLPKRTYYYATHGTVTVRYDGRTPQETNTLRLGRQRVALETQYEQPAGTLTSEQYRSADDPDSFVDVWYPNPADVLDSSVIETEVTLEGDGLTTPRLLSGFPRFEYKLLVGSQVQPTLNKPDGTEFPGAVVLDKREEWYPNTGIDVRVLPSGRVRRGKTHEPVGYIPKLSLWAFRPESVKYLMEKWGTEELIVDWVDDEVLTLKLLSSPEFERQHGTRDGTGSGLGRAAEWKSKEIAAEVVSVRKRITP